MTGRQTVAAATIASLLVVAAFALGVWVFRQADPESPAPPVTEPAPAPPPTASPGAPRIKATLYFLSGSGRSLAAEDREIAFTSSLQGQARQVVRELLAGSRRGLTSAFPEGVALRGLFISPEGLCFVDLSQELIANHPGGSDAEQLTVYSLANTLTTNFPAVKKVRVLVEGRGVESLAGHLDLTIPYGRRPDWIEGAVAAEPHSGV